MKETTVPYTGNLTQGVSIKSSLAGIGKQVTNLLRRVAIPVAVSGTTGAWIYALADRPVETCLCALLVTVCAAVNHSAKEGGEI